MDVIFNDDILDLVKKEELPVFQTDLEVIPPMQIIYRMSKSELMSLKNIIFKNEFGQIKILNEINLLNFYLYNDDIVIQKREVNLSEKFISLLSKLIN